MACKPDLQPSVEAFWNQFSLKTAHVN